MVLVRATTMTDWQALREIRLQALLDAPDAFGSTHAREAAFGEDEWCRRAGRYGSFIAFLPEVHLWVTETNSRARLLYERCGFTATTERQPLPSNPALGEIGMQRLLEPGPL
jgi:hypothetical protein